MICRYEPGHILIIFVGDTAHKVSPWTPTSISKEIQNRVNRGYEEEEKPINLKPGRIGNVFYYHADVVEALKDKEKGFFYKKPRPYV